MVPRQSLSLVLSHPNTLAPKRELSSTQQESASENPDNGLKFFSILNAIKDFDIFRDFPFDPMHCLLEGIGRTVISFIFIY